MPNSLHDRKNHNQSDSIHRLLKPIFYRLLFFSNKGPVISYKMPMAASIARHTICSNRELIETQNFLMAEEITIY
jgi:hypothetical protein